jgi:molybdenum cofactor cytidylyltransferase
LTLDGWSALILAGGAGRRFGGGKLLAPLAGEPVIRRVANAAATTGFAEIIVITGADDAGIRTALAGTACRIEHAADWSEGMAATLRKGIAALAPDAAGVCVFLGDMPLVPVQLCRALIDAAEAAGYAARPHAAGKPGHPVAFTRAAFADLAKLKGDQGGTALLNQRTNEVAYLETEDSGAFTDIDTPADLAAAVRVWNTCATSATSDSAISRGDLPKP